MSSILWNRKPMRKNRRYVREHQKTGGFPDEGILRFFRILSKEGKRELPQKIKNPKPSPEGGFRL
jgi:hypothetical protein